jgi:hypothetical protein
VIAYLIDSELTPSVHECPSTECLKPSFRVQRRCVICVAFELMDTDGGYKAKLKGVEVVRGSI